MSCFLMKTNHVKPLPVFSLGPESNQNVTRGGWRASVFPASSYWIYLIASFDLMCVCLEGLDLSSSLPPSYTSTLLPQVSQISQILTSERRAQRGDTDPLVSRWHFRKSCFIDEVFSSSRPPLRQDVLWGRRITHGLTSSICAAGDVWRRI